MQYYILLLHIKYQTSDLTLLRLHHLSISLAYKALHLAIISTSKWEPSIYMKITSPQCISDIISSCVDIKIIGKTNIVLLMAKPSIQLELILLHELKYPNGAPFCFEGCNGVNDQNRSVPHIIDCAKKTEVTQLVPGHFDKIPSQISPLFIF